METVPRDRIELSTHGFSVRSLSRFAAKVDRSAGPEACWPWTGSQNGNGYGKFAVTVSLRDVRFFLSHRFTCAQHHGPPPFPGAEARHSCHNRVCCNPLHLSWGTTSDNRLDSLRDGRLPRVKLNERIVAALRGAPHRPSLKQLGRLLGIGRSAACAALNGTTWRHVTAVRP